MAEQQSILATEEFALVARIMESSMAETNRVTDWVLNKYKTQAESRGEALQDILDLLYELKPEVPRSSVGGELVERAIQKAHEALYPR